MKDYSRRKFIKGAAVTGVAAFCLPSANSIAAIQSKPAKTKLKEGAVILFQGDSITDGNRGRNTDPNHIMGHGYAFSIASRVGADYPEKRYRFYNRGISGNKITDLEKRWQAGTLDLKPDVLSILVGVNDSSSVVFNREPVVLVEKYEATAVFVGFQEVFDKACEKAPAGYWIWDGVHPTVAGHELLAREWLIQVEKRISF